MLDRTFFCHSCSANRILLQKPLKLRHMLSKYGELGRLYLAPEGKPAPYLVTYAHLV